MKSAPSLRRQILAAVLVPPVAICLISAATVGVAVRLNLLLDRVAIEDRVIARASAASRMMAEEQAALADYLASRSPGVLGPYRKAEPKLDAALDDLARLVSGDPEQSRVLALVRKQKDRWAGYAAGVAGGGGAMSGGPEVDARARELMDGARFFLTAFLGAEAARRDRLGEEARLLAGSVLPGSAGGGAVLMSLIAVAAGRKILRLGAIFEDFRSGSERQDRERLGLFSEAIRHYAIFTLDAEGRISGWNQDSERLLGYRPDDVLARSHSYLFEDDDRRRDMPQKALSWAVQEGRAEDIRWVTRKDGFRFQARVALVAIRDADGTLRGFTTVMHEVEEGD